MADRHLTIAWLYPSIMSQYGDRGNVTCLVQRCGWRGIDVTVRELEKGDPVRPNEADILLMGGGADSHQRLIAEDLLKVKGDGVRQAVDEGAAALMVCGAYQLWGQYYRPYRGDDLPGLGIFNAYTVHRAAQIDARLETVAEAGAVRSVENLVVQWGPHTLVGFENHGGRTYLNPDAQPLGRVLAGGGNNSEDGWEGCVYKNAIGTYLHGSVLPKNPHLADFLVAAALRRRYGEADLEPLDDRLELESNRRVVQRILRPPRKRLGQLFRD